TPRLIVSDGGRVGAENQGTGNAGSTNINARQIFLDRQGSIAASTASGEGGDISLRSQLLLMRSNSTITATASGTGNGGNITIESPIIVGLQNSDIVANAVQGRGGNIQIITRGIFGLTYRPQLTPESDITASSQFGLSGTVAITNPEVDTRSFLVELPHNLVDPSQQISSGCDPTQGNTFTVTGRGGLPENPSSALLGRAVWWDNRDLSDVSQTASLPAQNVAKSEPSTEIVEATGWVINAQGQVELVAQKPNRIPSYNAPNCRPIVAN
ncbi:MAG TPA: filamentous hemagglutinin, partial [Cyanobacteria bacterium UBA11369]|nr:filamentous hemagglutinin [Cyanobacteria bacterium UBA11369]